MALSLLCIKFLFISTGVLSVAFALKNSVPVVVEFSTTQAPAIWSGFCSWLKPPYLYVIINGIIISIAASSRFYNTNQNQLSIMLDGDEEREREIVPDHDSLQIDRHHQSYCYDEAIEKSIDDERTDVIRFDSSESTVEDKSGSIVVENEKESPWMPIIRTDLTEMQSPAAAEKPLVSSRFCQRKPARVTPEGGRTLGVSKPKRQETLENTWKMITEGRSMPLNRHLKKSDTFAENFNGRQREMINTVEANQVKKSETFKDRTNYQSPAVNVKTPLKLKKEPTLTNDELNRRVEAFIKKFNQEMRLQRQESLSQYKEIVNR